MGDMRPSSAPPARLPPESRLTQQPRPFPLSTLEPSTVHHGAANPLDQHCAIVRGSVSVAAWSTDVKVLAVMGKEHLVSSLSKGVQKAEVTLRWDPSPLGEPANDLDIVAATYETDALQGEPSYVVHFDSRSPDGTIILTRDSRTGQGFGNDEVMTLEFDRLAAVYGRVVVGVVIQQRDGRKVFGDVANTVVRVLEGHTELGTYDFSNVSGATAAVVGEFTREETGEWQFREVVRGFDADPQAFISAMGSSTY